MLPFNTRNMGQTTSLRSLNDQTLPDYIRRLCDFNQMDFESSFEQLLCLLSQEPQKVLVF